MNGNLLVVVVATEKKEVEGSSANVFANPQMAEAGCMDTFPTPFYCLVFYALILGTTFDWLGYGYGHWPGKTVEK